MKHCGHGPLCYNSYQVSSQCQQTSEYNLASMFSNHLNTLVFCLNHKYVTSHLSGSLYQPGSLPSLLTLDIHLLTLTMYSDPLLSTHHWCKPHYATLTMLEYQIWTLVTNDIGHWELYEWVIVFWSKGQYSINDMYCWLCFSWYGDRKPLKCIQCHKELLIAGTSMFCLWKLYVWP